MKVFHILNGDALKDQLPAEAISGKIIIARECLVDGDVGGNSLDELIQSRIKFMSENYGVLENEYVETTVPELRKIANIDKGEVNVWFEDDLFCQVNLWFTCHLLKRKQLTVHLIRPTRSLQYGFASYSPEELLPLLNERISLSENQVNQFSKLWKSYQSNNENGLIDAARKLAENFPFVEEAIDAHLKRLPLGDGLPEQSLREIINDLDTKDFGIVFGEFSKRHPIYGFGDLQVKRLFDQVQEK